MLYAVPRCSPAARATSLAFSGRSDRCSVRRNFAAATIAPTGFPRGPISAISADLVCAAGRRRLASVAATFMEAPVMATTTSTLDALSQTDKSPAAFDYGRCGSQAKEL